MRVCEHLAFNRNSRSHRYASQRPPGNGKIDAARIADLVPRLNGALPISYTQFPSKRKKNASETFVSASTLAARPPVRPRNYFSPNPSLSSGAVYSTAEPHACKRDSSKFTPRENYRNIIFSTRALLSELCAPSVVTRRRREISLRALLSSLNPPF